MESLDFIYASFFATGLLCVFYGIYLKRRAKDSIEYETSLGGVNDRIHGTTLLGIGLCVILIVGVYTAYRKGLIDCKKLSV
jgi:hypothetical protein